MTNPSIPALKHRHRYPLVSAFDVRPGFPGALLEFEQKSEHLSNLWIYSLFTSVPTALAGTLPKASHREYRPKRVPERANGGMEWIWLGTLEPAGRPGNGGVQPQRSRFQRNVVFVNWRRERDSNTRYVADLQASDYRKDNFRNLGKNGALTPTLE